MSFSIGQILSAAEYTAAANWCNKTGNATIRKLPTGRYEIIELPTPMGKEAAAIKIAEYKARLAATDYVVIKISEGVATADEYSAVLEKRREWRAGINKLEEQD